MKTYISIAFILFFSVLSTHAQKIIGFWEIKKVEVGGQIMTPIAKWTKINKDGSYQSGNGWLQNSEGAWTFDSKKKLFSPKETNGIIDEYGPFTVDIKGETMTWLREEDDRIVTVTLLKISELPKAPGDQLVGLWDLSKITKNGEEITETFDPNDTYYLFLRWDKICTERSSKGNRTTSYWFINPHKPELTLLPRDKGKPAESWKIKVDKTTLKMTGISSTNKNIEMDFTRRYEFPK